jgi:hypothetical protein
MKYLIDDMEIHTHHKKPSFWFKHQDTFAILFMLAVVALVIAGTYYTVLFYQLTH